MIFLVAVVFAKRHDILVEKKSLATSPSQIKLLAVSKLLYYLKIYFFEPKQKKGSIKKKFWERVKSDHRWLCIFYRTADSHFSTARRVSSYIQ